MSKKTVLFLILIWLPKIRANTLVQLPRAYLDPRAEMGPSVAWNSLLIELFCLNCAQMALEGTESDFGLQD